MGIRSDKEIYRALETRLREAQKPITCVDLMDDPDFQGDGNCRIWQGHTRDYE